MNTNKAFMLAWTAIKGWLDPMIVQKILFFPGNTCDELKQIVPPD